MKILTHPQRLICQLLDGMPSAYQRQSLKSLLALFLNAQGAPQSELRQRVIEHVRQGHSVEETANLFQVSPGTIYRGQQRSSLERTPITQRRRKPDPTTLQQHLRDYPEAHHH